MRNPTWEYDELLLALDLYQRRGQVDAGDPEVVELSGLLRSLPIHPDRPDVARYRDPNGVALKLSNFAALDPSYPGVGMQRGGSRDRELWDRYGRDPAAVRALAIGVRRAASDPNAREPAAPEDEESEVAEGRLLFRQHMARERNRSIVSKKKAGALARTGALACEICGFDFGRRYGLLGQGFIECHHVVPLADIGSRRTRLADLVLVCANCHRMIHRAKPWRTPDEIKELLLG